MKSLWRGRQDGGDDLRKLLQARDSKVPDIVSQISFLGLWKAADREVVDFIFANFDDVVKYAFRIKQCPQKQAANRCAKVITTGADPLRSMLFTRGNLTQIVIDFVRNVNEQSHRSIRAYFKLLPWIVFAGKVRLRPQFENDQFFVMLFKIVECDPADVFLNDLLLSLPKGVPKILKRIKFCTVLLDNALIGSMTTRRRSLALLRHAAERNVAYGLLNALASDGIMEEIVGMAITTGDYQVFEFVNFIMSSSQGFCIYGPRRKIRAIVGRRLPDFAWFVKQSERFTRSTEACARLACVVFAETRMFVTEIRSMYAQLGEKFFALPHNSFVHNVFLKWTVTLADAKVLDADLIAEMGLSKKIVNCYRQRDRRDLSCYWGQMREVSGLIDSLVARSDRDEWKNAVMSVNNRKEELLVTGYGGSVPIFRRGANNSDLMILSAAAVVLIAVVIVVCMPRLLN